jgi:hypothetical protein
MLERRVPARNNETRFQDMHRLARKKKKEKMKDAKEVKEQR